MDRIETVCFDLDNTLCVPALDDDEIHELLFDRVAMKPRFTPSDVRSLDPATLPDADTIHEFYENMYAALAPEYTTAEHEELARVTDEIIDQTDVEFRDGAGELFEYARSNYTVGLLTHGDPEIQRGKLDALGIRDAFAAVVVCGPATDLPGKPAPEPFEHVLTELDATADRTLLVGDSLEGDIAGANSVGMQSAWMPQGDHEANPELEPTYVVESPTALRDFL
jgi:HAD superfamily hydrolase (TIGR01549 family)